MSPLHLALVVIGLGAVGTTIWHMITSQISINKDLAKSVQVSLIKSSEQYGELTLALQEVVSEFKIAITKISTQYEGQEKICGLHRREIEHRHLELEGSIVRVDQKVINHLKGGD